VIIRNIEETADRLKKHSGGIMQTRHHASKKMSVLLLGLSVLLLTAFTAAHADTLTETFTTSTPIAPTLTDWTSSLAFQQFNPSLGTLQSVTLGLSSGLTTTLTVKNIGSTIPSNGNASTEVLVAVVDPSGIIGTLPTYTPFPVAPSNPQLDYMSGGFSYNSLAAGTQVTSGTLTGSESNSTTYTAAGLLAEFTGAGNILMPTGTLTYTNLSNSGGNTESSQVTYAHLTGTVTYTYTPVPVPSALLLLGPGLIGLVGLRKRYTA
jgi:hypothetical protein